MPARVTFKEVDMARAIKVAKANGFDVRGCEVTREGVRLLFGDPVDAAESAPETPGLIEYQE